MRALFAGLAVLAGCAAAQDCASVGGLLQAPDLQKKAWGAHLAGRCVQRERGPDLAAELDQVLPDRGTGPNAPEYWLVQSLLDALIRLQQPVAPSTALALQQTWPEEALVLLVENAQAAQQQLLFLLDTRLTDPEWLAVTNSLAALKAAGFAAKLMRETRFTLTLSAVDPGTGIPGGTYGSILSGEPAALSVPQGFPPTGLYALTLNAAPGDALLAAGTHPVYYRRTVTAPGQPAARGGEHGSTDRHPCQVEHLATLSGLPLDSVRSAVDGAAEIHWHGIDALTRDQNAAIEAHAGAVARLEAALQSTGALSGAEASLLAIRIQIRLEDRRSDRSIPLPAAPPEIKMRFNQPEVQFDKPPAL